MKKNILLFVCMVAMLPLFAQSPQFKLLTGNDKEGVITAMNKASTEMNTLKCDFVQEKKLTFLTDIQVSKGVMFYKKIDCLRWEYQTPNSFIFILNNKKIYLKNEKGTSQYNTNSNKTLGMISQLIVGAISGESLKNSHDFQIEYYTDGKQILIKLIPLHKNFKKMILEIELYVDHVSYIASKMIMKEASGDVMTLSFSNVQKNLKLSEGIFELAQ